MTKSFHPLAVGVIGCGDIASTRHIPTIHASGEAVLSALCDVNTERVQQLASKYGVPLITADYRDILQEDRIEAVVIATPPWVTPKLTMEALRAGKHVLCEKPMALDVETAEQVIQVEKQSGRKLQIGFTYRHGPLMDTLRSWIREGRLGSPLLYRISVFDETWDPSGNPEHYERLNKTMERGSPSIHDGAHIADYLHFLAEQPVVNVRSFGMKSRPEFASTNYDVSVVSFADGSMAKVEIGWFFPKFPYGEFEVIGPKGIAVFDRTKQVIRLEAGSVTETVTLEEDLVSSCFKEQLRKFIHSIRSGETCVPGSAEGLSSLRLTKRMEACLLASLP